VNRRRVALESERFPRFEKSLERGQGSAYEEEHDFVAPVAIGILLFFCAVYVLHFDFISESIVEVLAEFGALSGFAIFTYGIYIRKRALKNFQFHGLSRRTISAVVQYLDSVTVPVEQIESTASHQDGSVYKVFQIHELFEEYLRLMKCLRQMILWPQEQVGLAKEYQASYRRRIGKMIFITLAIGSILIAIGLPPALTFERSEVFIAVFLLVHGVCAIGWALVMLYGTIGLCDIKWLNDISVSDSISLSDTLNEILLLLVEQYDHPLRFFVAGQYEVMTYTGRTKTTFTSARLKEAVLYPS
jgi:hypothetical protein